jgi:hypothetical protein
MALGLANRQDCVFFFALFAFRSLSTTNALGGFRALFFAGNSLFVGLLQ